MTAATITDADLIERTASTTTVQSVGSVSQAAAIAWRWARAFDLYRDRPLPQVLTAPGTLVFWWLNLLYIGRNASEIIELGVAAAHAPNPVTRPRQAHLPTVLAAIAAPIFAVLMAIALIATSEPLLQLTGLVLAAVLVAAIGCAVPALVSHRRAARFNPEALSLRAHADELSAQYDRPAAVVARFGAWPRGTGAGTELLESYLTEAHDTGLIIVGYARTPRLIELYRKAGGVRDGAGDSRRMVCL